MRLQFKLICSRAFRNEIYWVRTNAHNFRSRYYQRVCDILLFYAKSDRYTWNPQFRLYSSRQLKRYKTEDDTGRLYTGQDLTVMGTSPGRQFEWRGTRPPSNRVWGYAKDRLEQLWSQGRILQKHDGSPRLDGLKVYLDQMPGKAVTTVWDDIPRVGNTSGERLGYPTQKPLALLERVVLASSNEGDLVLDPFCGCGTTIDAAQKLGRRWIGIDITHLAINLIRHRLKDTYGDDIQNTYEVVGEPMSVPDARVLATQDPYQFQWWALGLVGARPVEGKKGADKGVDGRLFFHDDPHDRTTKQVVFSVKAGKTGVAHVRDLRGVVEREGAAIGVLISMHATTKEMRAEAATAGFYASHWGKHPRIQLLTVGDLLRGGRIDMPPAKGVNVTFRRARRHSTGGDEQMTIREDPAAYEDSEPEPELP